jgi:HrpA-like RNA helicase
MPALSEIGNASFAFREMTEEEVTKNKRVPTMDFVLDYFFGGTVATSKHSAPPRVAKTMNDHVKLLSAATGSGKGSIGFELYMRYWNADKRSIAVLEPTITTAISIPLEIVSNVPKIRAEFRMGKNVGYQTGHFVRKPVSGVVFMTTGVLGQMLRVMTDEQFMRRFKFILLDEAHMRRLDTDIILFLLKKLLLRNLKLPECPMVIAMSGTMPVEKYARYLDISDRDIINVNVQQYPKEENYAGTDVQNYVDETVATILKIHTITGRDDEPERGDIIVFVQSAKPGTDISEKIALENERLDRKILITNINSDAFRIGTSEYFDVLRPLANASVIMKDGSVHVPQRRLIIGTPAMEAGLTIGTAKYCIDTGYEYSVQYNPVYGCTVEGSKPVSRAMAIQRIGRIGRKFPGSFYMMYTKETFESLESQSDPDIWTRDIASMLLNLAVAECMPQSWSKSLIDFASIADKIKPFDATALDLVDAPSADSLGVALEKLFLLGFIDASCRPTLMGCTAIRFPRSALENMRMIFAGYTAGANVEDLITMAAILEATPSMLVNTSSIRGEKFIPIRVFSEESDQDLHEKQQYVGCDLIELLFAFYEIRARMSKLTLEKKNAESRGDQITILELRDWMAKNGLIYEKWLDVFTLRDQLLMLCISCGLDPFVNGLGIAQHKYNLVKILRESRDLGISEIRKLKSCIVEGFRLNIATWSISSGAYKHDLSGATLSIKSLVQNHVSTKDAVAARPRKIVIFNNSLKLPMRSTDGRYAFESTLVSVIDDFVNLDETFAIS